MSHKNAFLNLLHGYLKAHKDIRHQNWLLSNNGQEIKVYGPRRSFWSFQRDHLATIYATTRLAPVVIVFHPESFICQQITLEATTKSFARNVETRFS